MCLTHRVRVLNRNGPEYTTDDIDILLKRLGKQKAPPGRQVRQTHERAERGVCEIVEKTVERECAIIDPVKRGASLEGSQYPNCLTQT